MHSHRTLACASLALLFAACSSPRTANSAPARAPSIAWERWSPAAFDRARRERRLVLHDLGAFGFYSRTVAGLQFDWVVHTFFGIVGGLVLARALEIRLDVHGFALAVFVVLAVTGTGALHEIVEAASTMFLGAERGMLYVGPDNPFDTQQDMLCNVIGSSAACAWRSITSRR